MLTDAEDEIQIESVKSVLTTGVQPNLSTICLRKRFYCNFCPRRDFAQKAKSRGGTLVTRAYIKVLTVEIYSHTVNVEKISNRGREVSVGNDDVSIVCARKYEMVRMT